MKLIGSIFTQINHSINSWGYPIFKKGIVCEKPSNKSMLSEIVCAELSE